MRVEVTKAWLETPEKICLEWSTDFDDSEVFKKHSLVISYDTEVSFSSELATFIFINTILVCYCKYYHESLIEFTLPIELSKSLQLNIEKYHSISFISNSVIDLNIRETYSKNISKYENALFYGGGKDSLLSALLQRSIYGAENIVLLRLVWDVNKENLTEKRAIIKAPLQYMKEIGVESVLVESNFHNIIKSRDIGKLPNLALYPALMLPLIISLGVKRVVNGYDAGHFHFPSNNKFTEGKMPFSSARPEQLSILSDSVEELVGKKLYFRNYNYAINENIAFEILSKAYKEHWNNIYMCERLAGKWCIKCKKCFLYSIACLSFKMESEFNLGYFFQNSVYIKELLNDVSENIDQKGTFCPPYIYRFSYPTHFCSMIRLCKNIDLDYARKKIEHSRYPEAYDNFMKIVSKYRVDSYTDYDYFWFSAYELDLITSKDPNGSAEREKMLSLLDNARVGISYKSKFIGLNRERGVLYDYS